MDGTYKHTETDDSLEEFIHYQYSHGMVYQDWLQLNTLSESTIDSIADNILIYRAINRKSDKSKIQPVALDLSIDQAWKYCADVISRNVPGLAGYSHYVLTNCIIQSPTSTQFSCNQAMVVDMGYNQPPLIQLSYNGYVSDLLSMIHEFAHAVQIVACQLEMLRSECNMGSIYRECCAFLAELILIEDLNSIGTKYSNAAKEIWAKDSARYYGSDLHQLKLAIRTKPTHYNYRWNYPIARYFSTNIWKHKQEVIGSMFCSGGNANAFISKDWIKEELWKETY